MKEVNRSFRKKGDTLYLVSSAEAVDYFNSAIDEGLVSSLHRIPPEGIFQGLVECCKENGLGFDITGDSDLADMQFLHGNTRYAAIISVDEGQEEKFVNYSYNHGIDIVLLGHVTKGELRMDDASFGFISDYTGAR